jgi:hypothetical protein
MSSPPPRNSICWTAEPVGCARLGVGIALAFGCLLGVARAEGGCPEYATPPRKLGGVPAVLPELSGMAASRRHPGVLWAHNDSGNDAEVFAVRETGEVLATLRLAPTTVVDPEDIAVGPCRTERRAPSCIFLADIGDNLQRRRRVRLLEIDEPAALRDQTTEVRALPFVYADGAHDAEVLLIHPTTGATWIVTKLLSSLGGLYRLDDLGLGRVGRAVYRRTLEAPAGFGGLTTGGDVHPDAARVLLRTYNRVWEYRGDPAASIETILAGIPVEVPTARQPQGEAVTYLPDGRSYLLGSEKVGTPFYRVDCRTPAAPAPPESPPAAP